MNAAKCYSSEGDWNADLLWLVKQPEQRQKQAAKTRKESAERALLFLTLFCSRLIGMNGEQLFCFGVFLSRGRWEEEDGRGARGRVLTWEWNVAR